MYINDQKSQVQARLLTAESNPYNFNGNEGISNKVRVLIGSEIIVCNATLEQINDFKKYEGKDGVVVIQLKSRKEKLTTSIESFELED